MSKLSPKDTALNPLQLSDRVDHPKFGIGTISAPPERDKYQVLFDNPDHGTKFVVGHFLSLVTRPDAKGGPFWANEYACLLNAALNQRYRTDETMKRAFRNTQDDPIDVTSIRTNLEKEKANILALLEFLEADEAGEHP